jgi:hypothetical protein
MLNQFFSPENRAVYKTMWKNIAEPGRLQMKIWRMRIACWIPKARNTYTEYVILIALALKALRYKPAGRGFDSRWCHWNVSMT